MKMKIEVVKNMCEGVFAVLRCSLQCVWFIRIVLERVTRVLKDGAFSELSNYRLEFDIAKLETNTSRKGIYLLIMVMLIC